MSNSVLPGDKIAIMEEYEAGNNACADGHIVRATVIGQSEIDKKERVVNVKNHKPISIPEKGDIVIVNTQGGPVTTAEDEFITEIMKVSKTENVMLLNTVSIIFALSHSGRYSIETNELPSFLSSRRFTSAVAGTLLLLS
jgi:exosome complex RNA-binding protein Csl4